MDNLTLNIHWLDLVYFNWLESLKEFASTKTELSNLIQDHDFLNKSLSAHIPVQSENLLRLIFIEDTRPDEIKPDGRWILLSKYSHTVEQLILKKVAELFVAKTPIYNDQTLDLYITNLQEEQEFREVVDEPFYNEITNTVLIIYSKLTKEYIGSTPTNSFLSQHFQNLESLQKDDTVKTMVRNTSDPLSNTEKMILVELLQESKLFPGYGSSGYGDKPTIEFISFLLGQKYEAIKKAKQRASDITRIQKISEQEKLDALKSLSKLKPIIRLLHNENLTEALETLTSKYNKPLN